MNPDNNPADLKHLANPLHTVQADEQIICEIKRHPIGIVTIYIAILFALSALAMLVFLVAPTLFPNASTSQINYYNSLIILLAALLGVGYAFVKHIVYWGNRWVVTTDSVTQVVQTGLFVKQASQLSLENLEDVASEKNGVLMQMFDFGVLKAETAGERSKFVFLYCPKPNEYAKKILNARELFMRDVRAKESGRLDPGPAGKPSDVPDDGYTVPS